jgi:hypothetical protein
MIDGRTIELRVEAGGAQTARYAYSLDGGRSFVPFGDAIPLARFSWWKGSRPALFSYVRSAANGAQPSGWIDVDWVRVERPGR